MAQLYFIYSTMNSGKSWEVLKTAHNYERQDKGVLLFTSEKDTRYKDLESNEIYGEIATRLGLRKPAYLIERVDIFNLVKEEDPKCVLVDEAQFLSKDIVLQLARIVDELDKPVICYGLKNDAMNNLFEGSEYLLIYADKIQEIKTVCWYCNRKATMNMRLIDGNPVFTGEQIVVGGTYGDDTLQAPSVSYLPVCRKCYMHFKMLNDFLR